jgi:hypothetical protein
MGGPTVKPGDAPRRVGLSDQLSRGRALSRRDVALDPFAVQGPGHRGLGEELGLGDLALEADVRPPPASSSTSGVHGGQGVVAQHLSGGGSIAVVDRLDELRGDLTRLELDESSPSPPNAERHERGGHDHQDAEAGGQY